MLTTEGKVVAEGPDKLTFSGMGLYHPDLFLGIDPHRPSKLAPLLKAAMAQGRASAERHDGLWLDVGTIERLDQARRRAAETPL
ncbi:hypothetical protein D3C72_2284140 [compost metagenome]